jgi:sugar lactone lactonase YvrE
MIAQRRFGLITVVALLAVAASAPATASAPRVTVFAKVPDPGHPFGIGVAHGRVYVTTSAGLPNHVNTKGERVFTYTQSGRLVSTARVDIAPVSNMGLFGVAFDGSRRMYVADMNGRILRYALTPNPAKPKVWAQATPPWEQMGWYGAMWNDIAFDRRGNAYVTDDKPRIWRVTPDGEVSIFFSDPRLVGAGTIVGGPFGGRIGPDGKLYIAVTTSEYPDGLGQGIVFRLALKDAPQASDLEVFHRFPASPGFHLEGLAFGRSGRLYVAVNDTNEIAVLTRRGDEERRISSPLFHVPFGLAFLGDSLLVANTDFGGDNPKNWTIAKVDVGEPGLPLNEPANVR